VAPQSHPIPGATARYRSAALISPKLHVFNDTHPMMGGDDLLG
jgi:hypothetical protein